MRNLIYISESVKSRIAGIFRFFPTWCLGGVLCGRLLLIRIRARSDDHNGIK